jgi:hypothetical protein
LLTPALDGESWKESFGLNAQVISSKNQEAELLNECDIVIYQSVLLDGL